MVRALARAAASFALVHAVVGGAHSRSARFPFGVGVYNDTAGSPAVSLQLQAAANLTGPGGWVLLFLNTLDPSASPPTLDPAPWMLRAVEQAYALQLRPLIRLGQWRRDYRAHSDDAAHLNYTSLGQAYKRFVSQLPLPPPSPKEGEGGTLWVMPGNEPNVCLEWECAGGVGVFLPYTTIAAEYAAFSRDVLAALSTLPGLSLAVGPVAQVGFPQCECVPGGGGNNGAQTVNGTSFIQTMLQHVPQLYGQADFFSAHVYPSCGDGPWDEWCARGWLASYKDVHAVALPSWASDPRHNGTAGFPIAVSETGWQAPLNESGKAEWMTAAFQNLWLPDPDVEAVTPFCLAGELWQPDGFPWTVWDNATLSVVTRFQPQYLAVQSLARGTDGLGKAGNAARDPGSTGWE